LEAKNSEKQLYPDFCKFYDKYPRKVNKSKAWEVYRTVNPPSIDVLLAVLAMDLNNRNWSSVDFLPYPENWLNDRPWHNYTEEQVKKKILQMRPQQAVRPTPPPKQMELPLELPPKEQIEKAGLTKETWLNIREKDPAELWRILIDNKINLKPYQVDEFFGTNLELETKVS